MYLSIWGKGGVLVFQVHQYEALYIDSTQTKSLVLY